MLLRGGSTVIVLSLCCLFGSYAQGPNAPEAAGFEPVDATDMVNLSTGDLSYVLPLLDVEGFPVSLSYHAGMTTDIEASWAGLGWYLNPGAINRSVTNTPDDWKSGVGINFNSFYKEETYYGISVSVGLMDDKGSIGVGLNWGGGKGLSGSVSARLGPLSAMADTNGGRDLKLQGKLKSSKFKKLQKALGPVSANVKLSYSLEKQWSISGAAGYSKKGDNSYLGVSYSSSGVFSIEGKDKVGKESSVGMSADNFSAGDASFDVQSMNISIPFKGFTLGLSKQKVKINVRKGFYNEEWGALYSGNFHATNQSGLADGVPLINKVPNYNEKYNDYAVRTRSMDVYSTRLPQSESHFISDFSKDIENINFTFMGYDDYSVAAHGLMGSMTPRVFKNATIFGKGQRTKNEAGDNIHVFWHHGQSTNAVDRQLGRLQGLSQAYGKNDFYFYFDGQFTSIEKNDVNSIISSNLNGSNDINDLINEGVHSGTSALSSHYGRAKSPNYIEVFTNRQIASGHARVRGLITPAGIPDSERNDIDKFDPDGIGAYMITAPDGKTYHFALPVYHYEQVHRGQIDTQENFAFDIANVNERRQFSRYATHWLLTAITGPDYVDMPDPQLGGINYTFNSEDYGYWVELEYGKWSDGYVWRIPYQDRLYAYNTNLKDQVEEKDKGSYSFGRKQLYYLDKINTKNRTALFVKDIRFDALGKNLKFMYSNNNQLYLGNTGDGADPNSLKYTNGGIHVLENKLRPGTTNVRGVEYAREYTLKLSKVVLVDSKVGKYLSKNTAGQQLYNGYNANSSWSPNWRSPYFSQLYGNNYSYVVHNEQDVLDVNDVSQSFIAQNALKVVELNHSYQLAGNSPSSFAAPAGENPSKGRLTLESVQIKGRGGANYMPATSFNYYLENMDNIALTTFGSGSSPSPAQIKNYLDAKANLVDSWGFLQGEAVENGVTHNKVKAWSLKDITMPTGAKIEIDYEEDTYWTEAFARRFWQENIELKIVSNGSNWDIYVKNQEGLLPQYITDFTKYFQAGEVTFLDLWICHKRKSAGGNYKESWFDLNPGNNSNAACSVLAVAPNLVRLRIPKGATVYDQYDWNDSEVAFVNRWFHNDGLEAGNHLRGQCPEQMTNNSKRHYISHRLLANKVPENETGGGLRVKQLRTRDDNNVYKVSYNYNHPTKDRSSGITSYAPVNGLKYVPYQSEVPAPGVMYEYVTMRESSADTDDYYSETRYRHHVLKPVFNIFNPNLAMEALEADAVGEDRIFWATVTEDYGGLDGENGPKIKSNKVHINLNTALIGQLKSIENINSLGHVMMRSENEYINGEILANMEPNKGYVKETFNSMKTIFKASNNGKVIYDADRLMSISSKTEYNNMLKKTTTIAGNQKSSVVYAEVDPWLSSFRKSITTFADGTSKTALRIPAYEKYPEMASKVLNPDNKNMLTQEAMNLTTSHNGYRTYQASINTWNDDWVYRDDQGNESTESGIWRKHKTFVWKDDVDATYGNYLTNVKESNDFFNWQTGLPTSDKWQNTSEITQYTHWSLPVESRDINRNFISSKLADNSSKVIISGNARYSEIYYTGAEHVASANQFEGEVGGAQYQTGIVSHTGDYAVKTNQANDKLFQVSGKVGSGHYDTSKDFRPGKYKVSFWTLVSKGTDQGTALVVNGTRLEHAETVIAGCWKQFNYYIDLPPNSTTSLYVTNQLGADYYFDDFRMHPVYASVVSYVYDPDTDDLLYILDGNNLSTAFRYDDAGRLKATYKEVTNVAGLTGGFKIIDQYKYHYAGVNHHENYGEDINRCLDNNILPLALKGLSVTCQPQINAYGVKHEMFVVNGSGNFQYEWRWVKSTAPQVYTPWIVGGQEQVVPYATSYCSGTTFDKVWSVQARVTDLTTNQVVTDEIVTQTSGCEGYIQNPKILLGVEASTCHGSCENSPYQFLLHLLDQNINVSGPMSYKDNVSGETINLGGGVGSFFCPSTTVVASGACATGYVQFASITPVYPESTGLTYEFYLDCVSAGKQAPVSGRGGLSAASNANPGTMVVKDSSGKTLSVSNINTQKR